MPALIKKIGKGKLHIRWHFSYQENQKDKVILCSYDKSLKMLLRRKDGDKKFVKNIKQLVYNLCYDYDKVGYHVVDDGKAFIYEKEGKLVFDSIYKRKELLKQVDEPLLHASIENAGVKIGQLTDAKALQKILPSECKAWNYGLLFLLNDKLYVSNDKMERQQVKKGPLADALIKLKKDKTYTTIDDYVYEFSNFFYEFRRINDAFIIVFKFLDLCRYRLQPKKIVLL